MKTIDVDDAAPQYALGAALDAQAQHKLYWPQHTSAKRMAAVRLKDLAYNAYGILGSKIYLTAREKFITVKVDKPAVSATWMRENELGTMNAFVQAQQVEVVASKKNLLFRIPK